MTWIPSWEELLIAWTVLAGVWWIIAYVLARGSHRPPWVHSLDLDDTQDVLLDPRSLSVFKPLASPLDDDELERLKPCLESFISQLGDADELLLGCREPERAALAELVDVMRRRYPRARIRLIVAAGPVDWPNPKVAMLRILAQSAKGELWLWSDSDVVAPPDALRTLRAELAAADAVLLTCPYTIRQDGEGAGLLDKLYVNLEIHPGVLLLRRFGPVSFGLGAGMLFEADAFRRRVDWQALGRCLADDYHLGNRLAPVRVSGVRLHTIPTAKGLRGALSHYLRWQKTVRWCRPGGYAAQIVVLPVLGWLVALAAAPTAPTAWWGLAGTLLMDSVAAVAVCRALDAPISPRRLPALPLWSLARSLAWVASWVPGPVFWRGRRWWRPTVPSRTPIPVLRQGREELD